MVGHSNHLVVGLGEIGYALQNILKSDWVDIKDGDFTIRSYEFMHICIPYSSKFDDLVLQYQKIFTPRYTVIHSTVPVGTSRRLGALHSPVRGIHPNIEKGLRTFEKYVGGYGSGVVAGELIFKGIPAIAIENQEDAEASKLWDTTQYGVMILLNRYIKRWCDKMGVNFELVYTRYNTTYNQGYVKLGRSDVVRPYLKYMGGRVGGHCVTENAKLFSSLPSLILRIYDFYKKTVGVYGKDMAHERAVDKTNIRKRKKLSPVPPKKKGVLVGGNKNRKRG